MNGPTFRRLIVPLLIYGALVSLCGRFWARPWLLFTLLALLAGLSLLLFDTRQAATALLVGTVFGPAGESVAILQGAWSYAGTEALFPIWLPLAWGTAAVCLLVFTSEILRRLQGGGGGPRAKQA